MLGWIIVLIIGLTMAIGGVLWNQRPNYYGNGAEVVNFLGICFAIVASAVLIIAPSVLRSNVNDFIETKAIMAQVVSTSDYADIAIMEAIVDENEWLASARAQAKAYGIFSFYNLKELEALTPIEIPKALSPTS